jgi:hypothetical protein
LLGFKGADFLTLRKINILIGLVHLSIWTKPFSIFRKKFQKIFYVNLSKNIYAY